ncbi:hypothetical protein PSTG_07956 [Puccinia striiformis f. sp. tritici PST-78]|uniref:Alpha-type protein kinase domain-containing protein n=1 Tax=Puccinia striiformis f. sp. tritici PST-78 TaxID=1165861 RepID=A0A0L0VIE2_9BASI|nr:hypothetical protein PSTG_07956 [Puccinia striiformis f. sp. tritici PST-78]
MYTGFAHLLGRFRYAVEHCSNLIQSLEKKAKTIELVCYAVVAKGSMNSPEDVYFLEAFLTGAYVCYSSNFNFAVTQNQPGMDNQLFQIMNALTHWSCNQSKGKLLVSDLQGVSPILTDPQIIDMDPHSWSDGNPSQA